MTKPQLPNLQQTVANTIFIISISNSNNLNKFWVDIFTHQWSGSGPIKMRMDGCISAYNRVKQVMGSTTRNITIIIIFLLQITIVKIPENRTDFTKEVLWCLIFIFETLYNSWTWILLAVFIPLLSFAGLASRKPHCSDSRKVRGIVNTYGKWTSPPQPTLDAFWVGTHATTPNSCYLTAARRRRGRFFFFYWIWAAACC